MSDRESPQRAEELETLETPPADTDDAADTDDTGGNREAARYRTERNAARQERDRQAVQLETIQRDTIETICRAAHVEPKAVWVTTNLADLIDPDTGVVDRTAVNAAIEKARQELGIAPIGKGAYAPGAGRTPATIPDNNSWKDAFKPKSRR
ncbi:hypothetical protein [Gordonia paraffinivorans]|uniref:hypothetical protein n=1 Tax=Gordonia paraffinivorans TaxID=175628 RepID=UPI001448059B|nr:hypothetical protein [Gordonia paraffinivorans]